MIKPETISHEGTPAANWLDKCRAALTPATTSIGLIIVAVAIITIVAAGHSNNTAHEVTSSQQAPASSVTVPLTVTSLTGAGQADNSTVPANQSSSTSATTTPATGATNAPAATSNQPVGPAPTTSLNQLQSAGNSNLLPAGITEQVQNTVTGLTNTSITNL